MKNGVFWDVTPCGVTISEEVGEGEKERSSRTNQTKNKFV
jgi:hypothetical protein